MTRIEVNEKVLFVDDEPNILAAFSRQLGRKFMIDTATGGEEALELICKEGPYAVVVSDLRMPGMDGIQLLNRVKEIEPDTVRFVLTGFADLQNTIEAVNKGYIFRFLTKPCSDEDISRAVSEGIEHHRRVKAAQELHTVKRLKEALENVVLSFIRLLETRDPYTAGHQKRVAQLATALAVEMGLERERVEGIRIGAMIHDIGKICVPAEFLNKPGQLSDLEFGIVKAHAQVGHEVLQPVNFEWPIAEIILQHHERMDGSGYPRGLSGEDILLDARIVAVADVVEAMSSHRPYRPSLGLEGALQEIKRHRGTRYDAQVVDICLDLLGSKSWPFGPDEWRKAS